MEEKKISFDVNSVMNVLYNDPIHKDSRFIFADEGKKKLREGEYINSSKKDRNYSSFWKNKKE